MVSRDDKCLSFMQPFKLKVGDLVRIPDNDFDGRYWWAGKVGLVTKIYSPPERSGRMYRVTVSDNKYATFSDPDFVEVISKPENVNESR